MCPVVLAHDDFPDPFVGKFELPARHRGFPWHSFDREADAALFDSPEEITFLKHRDRCRIGKICWRRIESPSCRALTVKISPMAGRTECRIETFSLLDRIWCLGNRIRQARIFPWRSRMNSPVFSRRRIADRRTVIGLPADQQRKENQDEVT